MELAAAPAVGEMPLGYYHNKCLLSAVWSNKVVRKEILKEAVKIVKQREGEGEKTPEA